MFHKHFFSFYLYRDFYGEKEKWNKRFCPGTIKPRMFCPSSDFENPGFNCFLNTSNNIKPMFGVCNKCGTLETYYSVRIMLARSD